MSHYTLALNTAYPSTMGGSDAMLMSKSMMIEIPCSQSYLPRPFEIIIPWNNTDSQYNTLSTSHAAVCPLKAVPPRGRRDASHAAWRLLPPKAERGGKQFLWRLKVRARLYRPLPRHTSLSFRRHHCEKIGDINCT